jgi:hypothetical protein
MNLKKQMIGEDLILITECNEKTAKEIGDISDGCIFSYSKIWDEDIASFEDGEQKAIADFACELESVKSFIELPSFASCGDGYIEIEAAKELARDLKITIENDKELRLSSFCVNNKNYIFPSLENVKAVLELLSEYGYMGISFDVMRTPRAFLMMYNAMFKTVCATVSNSREGCSRELNA